jgi:hypothetical protein
MNKRIWQLTSLAAMFLAAGISMARSEEPARQRSTPIIFSEPQSDTVSSNLNQLTTKTSPFKELESGLKKPFEVFGSFQPQGRLPPPTHKSAPPSAPPVSNRQLKELIDKRAELMLEMEGENAGGNLNDPFKSSEDAWGLSDRARRNPLDRYYDRMDRERAAMTNQTGYTDLFGGKQDSESGERPYPLSGDKPFDGGINPLARQPGNLPVKAPQGGGLFSGTLKPRTFDDLLDPNSQGSSGRSFQARQTRIEEFKRLINGPAYSQPKDLRPSVLSPIGGTMPTTQVSPYSSTWGLSPTTTWPSSSRGTAGLDPNDSFARSAGLVGSPSRPQGLTDFATPPSLTPTPAPVTPTRHPQSTFGPPRRKF